MADHGQYTDSIGQINSDMPPVAPILAAARRGLTPAQRVLLNYITDFSSEHGGVMPSFDEMRHACGLRSKSGIHRLVTALEERGYIIRLKHRARAIALAPRGESAISAAIAIVLANCRLSARARSELTIIGADLMYPNGGAQ